MYDLVDCSDCSTAIMSNIFSIRGYLHSKILNFEWKMLSKKKNVFPAALTTIAKFFHQCGYHRNVVDWFELEL